MRQLSKTLTKYFEDLHQAEFVDENPREVIKLLKRAQTWKTHTRLHEVCVYLGAETDERTATIEGCKEIIQEDIDYNRGLIE